MKLNLTEYEKENYLLKDKKDLIILSKIKELEKKQLNNKQKEILKLIKTQLKDDWRTPLIKYLNKILREVKNER